MCVTCGCSAEGGATYTDLRTGQRGDTSAHDHFHAHSHDHGHDHDHAHSHVPIPAADRTIAVEQAILAKNQLAAERNRGWMAGREVVAINLMRAPGAGEDQHPGAHDSRSARCDAHLCARRRSGDSQ